MEEALEHAYLASLHDLSDEPVCQEAVNFDFDSETLTPDLVREVSCWQIGGRGEGWRAGQRSTDADLVREVSCWLSEGRERVGELDGWSTLQPMGLWIGA